MRPYEELFCLLVVLSYITWLDACVCRDSNNRCVEEGKMWDVVKGDFVYYYQCRHNRMPNGIIMHEKLLYDKGCVINGYKVKSGNKIQERCTKKECIADVVDQEIKIRMVTTPIKGCKISGSGLKSPLHSLLTPLTKVAQKVFPF